MQNFQHCHPSKPQPTLTPAKPIATQAPNQCHCIACQAKLTEKSHLHSILHSLTSKPRAKSTQNSRKSHTCTAYYIVSQANPELSPLSKNYFATTDTKHLNPCQIASSQSRKTHSAVPLPLTNLTTLSFQLQ